MDSRPAAEGDEIRRRRACESCGERFTTHERTERDAPLPQVVKRDGRRERFSIDKVESSVSVACRKRSVSANTIADIARRVRQRMECSDEREVASEQIGAWLLDELREVDEVAYARFASVYLRFDSLDDFRRLWDERP